MPRAMWTGYSRSLQESTSSSSCQIDQPNPPAYSIWMGRCKFYLFTLIFLEDKSDPHPRNSGLLKIDMVYDNDI